jgi:meso-butanediol dehydrogenase / (S,S)-butanediol dehydrogenase / diacetyl reductase
MHRFAAKHVLVTGGGTGIGRSIARRFAAEGASVTLVGRRAEPLEATARAIADAGGAAGSAVADIGIASEVRAALAAATARFGRVDVLVNNAGIGVEAAFLEIEERAWDEVFATNVKGTFLCSQQVGRSMAASGGGVILHNASIDAHGGERRHAPYNASKAALVALTRTMAIELAEHGIRVNAVSPGYTYVEEYDQWASDELLAHMRTSFARVPQRRLLDASEIAGVFAFLASDDASGITGHTVTVDGGLTADLFIQETWPAS